MRGRGYAHKELPTLVREWITRATYSAGQEPVGQDSPALCLFKYTLEHCWTSCLLCAYAPSGFPYGADCAIKRIYHILFPSLVLYHMLQPQIIRTVLHQFLHQTTTHPKVPQPVTRVIAVSQIGFDDNTRKLKFTVETRDHIQVDLLTPSIMLDKEGIK